jgi:site-specific DNA-methyltransferase (cytosine-N4-specific)
MPLSPIREITRIDTQPILPGFDAAHDALPPITEVRDFNFAGLETQHATHAIHPYVAAINPPLASSLINHYVPIGQTVLDPFCGGGGVLVEAVLSGRRAEGYDINPLAVLLTRVKTQYVSDRSSLREYKRILDEVSTLRDTPTCDVPELIRYWYNDTSLAPLCALRNAINTTTDERLREMFQVALSATARDVMQTYRGEIRLRKLQGRDLERFQPDVLAAFRKRAELAITRAACLPVGVGATVELRDARLIDERQQFHTAITSPPYADDTNGVGYFQFSRNMLYWVGYALEELKEQRQSFLGCGVSSDKEIDVPPSVTLDNVLAVIKDRSKRHYKQAQLFYRDYYSAIRRIVSVIEKRAVVVIGDRVLSRTHIDNGHITTEFMDALGFGLEHYHTREITKKRIPNLGGDGGGISAEHILIYRRR